MRDIEPKYYKNLYIAKSTICGIGLFAAEHICKGERILSFGGTLVSVKERYSQRYQSSTFVGITEEIALCEEIATKKDFSDYINHSCEPNAGLCDCITVVAIQDICKNEEICCDYAFWEFKKDWKLKYECLCGKENCRKEITGNDWKEICSKEKIFNYFSPFLKRRILKNEQEHND